MRIEVSTYVFAPPGIVWDVLTDWESQPEWMRDARSVEVVGDVRTGRDVEVVAPTRLLGFTVEDRMVVTDWREQRLLEVEHVGRIIRGTAAFELHPTDVGTRVVWREEIDAPLGALGELGARVAVAPYVRAVFRRSLAGLKALCEREARRERVDEA